MAVFLFYADVILEDLVLQIVVLLHQSVADEYSACDYQGSRPLKVCVLKHWFN